MGYSILRSPRRRFGARYSVLPMLAQVRAEADAKRDVFADARCRRSDAIARVTGRAVQQ